MPADSKKVQTMINITARQVAAIRKAVGVMNAVKAKFQAASPSVVGTVLQGNLSEINSGLSTIETEINSSHWDQLMSGFVKQHSETGLD